VHHTPGIPTKQHGGLERYQSMFPSRRHQYNGGETIVGGRRRVERLERRQLKDLNWEEIIRCLKANAPDTGNGYNKFLNRAGNLLQHTSQVIPTTWIEAIEMQTKVRAVMDSCPSEIRNYKRPSNDEG